MKDQKVEAGVEKKTEVRHSEEEQANTMAEQKGPNGPTENQGEEERTKNSWMSLLYSLPVYKLWYLLYPMIKTYHK